MLTLFKAHAVRTSFADLISAYKLLIILLISVINDNKITERIPCNSSLFLQIPPKCSQLSYN